MKCIMCNQREARRDSTLCDVCFKRPWMEQIHALLAVLNAQAKVAWKEKGNG